MSAIEIKNLTKQFILGQDTVKALDNVSLTVEKGDIFGIIGMSGAGKSTLVRSINFLERPTDGKVLIDGIDLGTLSEKELRKIRSGIGMIFQNFNLLEQKNVIDNVCFPLRLRGVKRKDARNKAKELLELVGLAEKEKAYPAQLSGGQKQRVAIARALATDPQTTAGVLGLIKEINEKLGITVVVITHQMSVVTDICSHVAIIDSGRLVEQGFVDDIFRDPKSSAAKELLSGKQTVYTPAKTLKEARRIRIVFRENSAFEPVIANLILKFQAPVNILKADTKNVGGKAVGEMILGLPDDVRLQEDIIDELKKAGLSVTEAGDNE